MRRVRLSEGRGEAAAAERKPSRIGAWVLSFLALSSLLIWAEIRSEMTRLDQLALEAPQQRVASTEPVRVPVGVAARW